MSLKIGQQVIWTNTSPTNSSHLVLSSGTVTKVGGRNGDTIWIDNQHKAEDALYAAFAFPDVPVCRKLLEDTIEMRARHDKESKDMLTRQIQTANEMVRQGLK